MISGIKLGTPPVSLSHLLTSLTFTTTTFIHISFMLNSYSSEEEENLYRMGNGCDPELSLRLGSGHYSYSANSDSSRSSRTADWFVNAVQVHYQQQPQQLQHQHGQQQITIFHNGRICVCDVTEIQARAIICMAKREMEKRRMEKQDNDQRSGSSDSSPSQPLPSSPPSLAPQLINPGLSMKRSLQRFLQKRKTRMDAASPYNCTAASERRSPDI